MYRFKFILETIISTLVYYSGFNWLVAPIMARGRNIPIIFYHEIGNNDKGGLTEFSVSVDHFERQIQWLSKRFNVVSINELTKHIKSEITLHGKVAAITFDGGYVGNWQFAFPILKKYDVPASIYVVTNSIDRNIPWERQLLYMISLTKNERLKLTYNGKQNEFEITTRNERRLVKRIIQNYMTGLDDEDQANLLKHISQNLKVEVSCLADKLFLSWDQLREMNESPLITIGSHSLTHPRLTDIPFNVAIKELAESKKRIESELAERINSFCYPDGHVSNEIKTLVRNVGYSSGLAVTTPKVLNDLNKIGDDIFELRRVQLPDRFYEPLISTEISGIMRILKKVGKLLLPKKALTSH